jgi:hypothetical protein
MEITDNWKNNIYIFEKEINENIFKFFNNKSILNDINFIKMIICIQDHSLYTNIKNNYPLFIFLLLKNINNNEEIYEMLLDIKKINIFTTLDIEKFKLWKYCYNEDISNFSYSNDTFEINTFINNTMKKYYKYDKNMIIEMLIFTYYSKKDLLKQYENDDKINDIISIYDYCKHNAYPLFKSSELTKLWTIKIQHLLKYKNEDAGHIWNKLNVFVTPILYDHSTDIIDMFFHILYNNISNGLVTKNILIWTYIFAHNIISKTLLSKLFSVIYETPENMTGLFSDLYNDNRIDIIEKLKEDFMDNDMEYVYKIYEKEIDVNFYKSLNNDTLQLLFEKEFIAKGEPFIDSNLNINTFDKNLFNIFMKNSPFISKFSLDNLIKNNNQANMRLNNLNELIMINNSLKLINSEVLSFKIANPNTFVIEDVEISNIEKLDKFNKKIIKKYIYDIFLDKYYIIKNNEDFLSDYETFNINKSRLDNFLLHITPLDKMDEVLKTINYNIKLYELFFNN